MTTKIFTISLDPEDTDIDSADIDTALRNATIEMFSEILGNPFDVEAPLNTIESYYEQEFMDQYGAIATANLSVVSPSNSKGVIQIDMEGEEILSSNSAEFSTNKTEAKKLLGSVEKISENEILMADSKNKRAIIVDTNTNLIKWEYISDRCILDAHLFPSEIEIEIEDSIEDYIYAEKEIVNKGQTVTWKNNSSNAIKIYSGTVLPENFDENFDIDLYGTEFESQTLNTGETYSYKFESEGTFGWFSYPSVTGTTITIGSIVSSYMKISPDDYFLITEGDGLESSFTSRVYKIDVWGNVIWEFGKGYLVHPKDARPLLNGKAIISI